MPQNTLGRVVSYSENWRKSASNLSQPHCAQCLTAVAHSRFLVAIARSVCGRPRWVEAVAFMLENKFRQFLLLECLRLLVQSPAEPCAGGQWQEKVVD